MVTDTRKACMVMSPFFVFYAEVSQSFSCFLFGAGVDSLSVSGVAVPSIHLRLELDAIRVA